VTPDAAVAAVAAASACRDRRARCPRALVGACFVEIGKPPLASKPLITTAAARAPIAPAGGSRARGRGGGSRSRARAGSTRGGWIRIRPPQAGGSVTMWLTILPAAKWIRVRAPAEAPDPPPIAEAIYRSVAGRGDGPVDRRRCVMAQQPPASEGPSARNRDDFTIKTRGLLAAETGYRCSNPHCGSPTIGPASIPGEIIDIGVAAHITAAAPGGPRFDASLSAEQRKSQRNGIWLCQSCAKEVDSDTSTHTIATLEKWKHAAIDLAARALALRDPDPDGRLRLAREQRHNVCLRALRSAISARALVLRGLRLAEAFRSAMRYHEKGISDEWVTEVKAGKEALQSAILDVRVFWPEYHADALISLYVSLNNWLVSFAKNYLILNGHPTNVESSNAKEDWCWDEVFQGNQAHIELMKERLSRDVSQVEKWATPHIAGREPSTTRQ